MLAQRGRKEEPLYTVGTYPSNTYKIILEVPPKMKKKNLLIIPLLDTHPTDSVFYNRDTYITVYIISHLQYLGSGGSLDA